MFSDSPIRSDDDGSKEGKLPKVSIVRVMHDAHLNELDNQRYARYASKNKSSPRTGMSSDNAIVVEDHTPHTTKLCVRWDTV